MIGPLTPLILGSGSPRRREILAALGLTLVVVPGTVDEQSRCGERPESYLERVVSEKLEAVSERVRGLDFGALLVADTVVVIGDRLVGKPASVSDAEQLLRELVGRPHWVLTRYAIASPAEPRRAVVARTVASRVIMRAASEEEIVRYARTGEGLDKAGAYAAQGIGAFLIERIEGSYSNVVGLPACEVVVDLRDAGLLGPFP